ncbi:MULTISPECIES: hypothetical protein [unclassified Halorhabdus]|jgi:hypothetical protein|nr:MULTISPECIES: hypothetical protein [unclassified Halorhabdus]
MEAAVIILLGSLLAIGILVALTRWLVPKTLAEEPESTAGH